MDPGLTGPLALTVGLAIAVAALWRDHIRADADDRAQRDTAITGWREATDAIRALTAAVQDQDKREGQHRRDDA